MPYAITLTNGRLFATVADGTLNQQSTMTLIGKDFAGYGQFVDQNFVRALENGASNTAPTTALTGQLWFDLTNYALRIANVGNIPNGALYTGANIQWRTAAPSYLGGATAPFGNNASKGDMWVFRNEAANVAQLRIYTGDPTSNAGGAGWAAVGPLNNNDTVNVSVINANFGVFTDPAGTGSLTTNLLYADSGNISGQLRIGRDANGAPYPNARIDATGTAGFYGNLNGDQPFITSLGNSDPNVTNLLTNVFVGTGGQRTTINAAGIFTQQGITANGQSFLANVTGTIATFTNFVGGTFNGRLATGTPSQFQPNVAGLGVLTRAYNGVSDTAGATNRITNPVNGPNNASIGVALAVQGDILPFGYAGNAVMDIGANTFGNYFGNVYARTFVGNLAGGFAPGFTITTDLNLPNAEANIGSINVPEQNGNVLIGGANSATGAGNVRIFGQTGDIITKGSVAFDVAPLSGGQSYDFGFTPGGATGAYTLTLGPNVTLDIQDNLILRGNLTVEGQQFISNTSIVTTEDKTITVANNVISSNVAQLDGSGLEAGNASLGVQQGQFLYYNTTIAPSPVDSRRWQTNHSLYVSSSGGSDGNLFADGGIYSRGTAGFQAVNALGNSSIAGGMAINNLFITGTGGYVTGRVSGALGGMLNSDGSVGNAVGTYLAGQTYPVSTSPTALTTPVRDSAGNISAVNFNGVASSARYADLAEMYLTDTVYPAGTILAVGGEAEVTICGETDHPIGVISTQPAFLMNKDLENGQPVALRGRVPVRFTGVCHKGDKIGPSSTPGVATRNSNNPVAIALHTAYADAGTETMVEAVIL